MITKFLCFYIDWFFFSLKVRFQYLSTFALIVAFNDFYIKQDHFLGEKVKHTTKHEITRSLEPVTLNRSFINLTISFPLYQNFSLFFFFFFFFFPFVFWTISAVFRSREVQTFCNDLNVQCPLIIWNISYSRVDARSVEYFVESALTPYEALDIAFFGKMPDTNLWFRTFICWKWNTKIPLVLVYLFLFGF